MRSIEAALEKTEERLGQIDADLDGYDRADLWKPLCSPSPGEDVEFKKALAIRQEIQGDFLTTSLIATLRTLPSRS
jgi:hypothetical protein